MLDDSFRNGRLKPHATLTTSYTRCMLSGPVLKPAVPEEHIGVPGWYNVAATAIHEFFFVSDLDIAGGGGSRLSGSWKIDFVGHANVAAPNRQAHLLCNST